MDLLPQADDVPLCIRLVVSGGSEGITPLTRAQTREALCKPAHAGRRHPSLEVRLAPGAVVVKPDVPIAYGMYEALALEVADVAFRTAEEPACAAERGAKVPHRTTA